MPHVLLRLAACLLASTAAQAAEAPLSEMPRDGELSYGKIVYVDDRKCPKGQIKEVIGGSREKDIPRSVRCIPRPNRATAEP